MSTHPDQLARQKELEKLQDKTCFPSYIKPWNGQP